MELIKELPEVFEEFAEQRQKSFLAMKGLKDQGVPVVGAYCTYFPAEIARAMGAVTVGLCSVSDETIPDAEKDLPKNLCPLIKSSYGFAKTDKCPFFYFSDVVVGETTCDGKKKMYEYMSDFKDVFVMELPNTQSEMALKLWKSELIRFKEYLEKKFDVEITDEAVLEAVKEENKVRKVMKDLYHVMALDSRNGTRIRENFRILTFFLRTRGDTPFCNNFLQDVFISIPVLFNSVFCGHPPIPYLRDNVQISVPTVSGTTA